MTGVVGQKEGSLAKVFPERGSDGEREIEGERALGRGQGCL